MTTDDKYVPDEGQVRAWCREGTGDYPDVMDEWLDRFLARVRRDAAREALDGLADEVTHVNWDLDGPAFALRVRRFKTRNYSEETP